MCKTWYRKENPPKLISNGNKNGYNENDKGSNIVTLQNNP